MTWFGKEEAMCPGRDNKYLTGVVKPLELFVRVIFTYETVWPSGNW